MALPVRQISSDDVAGTPGVPVERLVPDRADVLNEGRPNHEANAGGAALLLRNRTLGCAAVEAELRAAAGRYRSAEVANPSWAP